MGMIDDLIAIEDQKFLSTVDKAIAHAKALAERRPWRDRKGVIHILRPMEAVSITPGDTQREVYGWFVLCTRKQRSPLKDTDAIVTCLQCLGSKYD